MKILESIKSQINVVQLAFKKGNGNKPLELLMHIKTSDFDPFYWVMDGGAALYKGFFLEDAITVFNGIN